MYNEYFGFAEAPFSLTPDPRFSYSNSLYQEAFATLRYGIEARKGFIVITGEAGTGKTTLLRRLMQGFGRNVQTAYIFNTHVTLNELLRLVLSDLGLPINSDDRLEMVGQLNEHLIKQLRAKNIVTLLVDEAQELSTEMLEEIRLLSNLETDTEKLLQIVLMGQPELERKLDQPELRQLKQRVALRCRLDPLPAHEVGFYIASRLEAVGYKRKDLFDAAAIEKLAVYSRGIPRLINILCDNGLLIAFAGSAKTVSGEMIEEVARDMRLGLSAPVTESFMPPQAEAPPDGPIEHVEGFRTRRAAHAAQFVPIPQPAPEFDSRTAGIYEKPARRRQRRRFAGMALGVFTFAGVLVLVGVLFYSQEMWGGLIGLGDNIKAYTGLRQTPEPAAPFEVEPEPRPDSELSRFPSLQLPGREPVLGEQQVQRIENWGVIESPSSLSIDEREKRRSAQAQGTANNGKVLGIEGAAPAPPRPVPTSREPAISDADLQLQIQKAIANRAVQGVGVSVQDGKVHLKGRVATSRQRLAATRAAQSVAGVKAVENDIIVY